MDPITILTVLALLIAVGAALANLYPYLQARSPAGQLSAKLDSNPDRRRLIFVITGTVIVALLIILISRIYQIHQDTTLPDAAYSALQYHISQDGQATAYFNTISYPTYGPIGSWSVSSAQTAPDSFNARNYVSGFSGVEVLWCVIISPPLQWVISENFATSPPTITYKPISHFWLSEVNNQWQVFELDGLSSGSVASLDTTVARQAFDGVGCTY